MTNRVIIMGRHPIAAVMERQYRERGCAVERRVVVDALGIDLGGVGELCLLTNPQAVSPVAADSEILAVLEHLADAASAADNTSRPLCRLLLQSETTLRALRQAGLPAAVEKTFEVYPFTIADHWAQRVLVHLPGISSPYSMLDRAPITADSRQRAHLVIFGFDRYARALAINAALTAHYPNYHATDERPVRTRITIVDSEIMRTGPIFRAAYQLLFDHSFYREVNIANQQATLHQPVYHGQRREFVDVEWEFVDSELACSIIRDKLAEWVSDDSRQVTVCIATGDDERNLAGAMALPQAVYENNIPVWVQQHCGDAARALAHSNRFAAVRPFGMDDCGYDIALPLVQMAKLLAYFYACSYGNQEVPTVLPQADVDDVWRRTPFKARMSSLCNVMTICGKIHSIGRDPDVADQFYALTQQEVEILAPAEHNRWSVERLVWGARPCTDQEKQEIRKNMADILAFNSCEHPDGEQPPVNLKKCDRELRHFDLCAYEDLECDDTGKDVKTYDYDLTACIPLLANTFYTYNDHGHN